MKSYAVLLVSSLAVSSCQRSEADPSRAGAPPAASAVARPAPWEPFDETFRGCEGG